MESIDRIMQLIDQNKLTAVQLSKVTGLSKNIISEWKSGRIKPSADAIIKLAEYFGVSCDYLLTGKEAAAANNGIIGNANEKNIVAVGSNVSAPAAAQLGEMETELLRIFGTLDIFKKSELLLSAKKMIENK